MVRVGASCIDRYEASIWDAGSAATRSRAIFPTALVWAARAEIFARSVPGVVPRANITWFQAPMALANSGKRLPTGKVADRGLPAPPTGRPAARRWCPRRGQRRRHGWACSPPASRRGRASGNGWRVDAVRAGCGGRTGTAATSVAWCGADEAPGALIRGSSFTTGLGVFDTGPQDRRDQGRQRPRSRTASGSAAPGRPGRHLVSRAIPSKVAAEGESSGRPPRRRARSRSLPCPSPV